ncbi:MAG: PQQ-binding-like beta-propeller repeat protein [Planctomycetaceae bacterium]|nr:PQQ-binding-like beta-propeller repeat protein [Planctomycetaceae bacterium]
MPRQSRNRWLLGSLSFLLGGVCLSPGYAADWDRFRGPNGTGVSAADQPLPTEWSETSNLKWKTALPGPGLSSPIVVGDKIFVTCWSGYGTSREDLGDMDDLVRHVVCLDRKSGSITWDKTIPAVLPEEEFRGMFAENGYASHTPVSDGERVYAFLGKSGVYAFDFDGNELWHKDVGSGDDRRGWGTASSPVIYKDLLIVPAFIEDHALVAFDKQTGEEKWRQEADGFNSTWSTPVLVKVDEERTDLVVSVPYEVWGLNPDSGKLRWYANSVDSDSICSSLLVHDDVVYIVEGRNGGAAAIRAGGSGDVNGTHVLWSNKSRGRISTPLYDDGALCWIAGGILNRVDAATGEEIGRPLRLERSSGDAAASGSGEPRGDRPEGGERYRGDREGGLGGPRPDGGDRASDDRSGGDRPGGDRPEGGRFGGGPPGGFGGRGGFGGGRMGGQDYSSPVLADGKVYYVTRSGDGIVVKLGEQPEQLATNCFESDTSDYSATPAISNGQLFIRSNQFLYCVTKTD